MDFLVYAVCFGVGLLFAIVSAFLGHLFGGHDVHVDIGTGGHAEAGFQDTGMPGLSPFSPTTITAFLTAFGGLGLIFNKIEATHSPWISAPLALRARWSSLPGWSGSSGRSFTSRIVRASRACQHWWE